MKVELQIARSIGAPCPRCSSEIVKIDLSAPANLIALPVYFIIEFFFGLFWIGGLGQIVPVHVKCQRCGNKYSLASLGSGKGKD